MTRLITDPRKEPAAIILIYEYSIKPTPNDLL